MMPEHARMRHSRRRLSQLKSIRCAKYAQLDTQRALPLTP
jgi:hypothetical protein